MKNKQIITQHFGNFVAKKNQKRSYQNGMKRSLVTSEQSGIFFQILWPFENIWTLPVACHFFKIETNLEKTGIQYRQIETP